uniref:Uncharacterized protein n=1 Tax=Arundo donax TaxID=35708 RepID=A0A0A9BCC4_ARUDO
MGCKIRRRRRRFQHRARAPAFTAGRWQETTATRRSDTARV